MNTPEEEHEFEFTSGNSDRELLFNMDIETSTPHKHRFKQLYAHEMGHLVGLVLNDKQCVPFGIPTRISFEYEAAILEYSWTDEVFKVLRNEVEKDLYGFKGYEIVEYRNDCQTTKNYINKLYNLDRFPAFITYLILGGIFHLHWDSIINIYAIEPQHFDIIFSDDTDSDPLAINGAAGNDWTKVRMYCGEYEIPYEVLLEYRKKLYQLCLESGLFKHFEAKIEELYNADKSEYVTEELAQLKSELDSILDIFPGTSAFLAKLKALQMEICNRI